MCHRKYTTEKEANYRLERSSSTTRYAKFLQDTLPPSEWVSGFDVDTTISPFAKEELSIKIPLPVLSTPTQPKCDKQEEAKPKQYDGEDEEDGEEASVEDGEDAVEVAEPKRGKSKQEEANVEDAMEVAERAQPRRRDCLQSNMMAVLSKLDPFRLCQRMCLLPCL